MPIIFNRKTGVASGLVRIRLQGQTQPTSTSATQPASYSHRRAHAGTSRQASQDQQAIDNGRVPTGNVVKFDNKTIAIIHAAMKWGLNSFTGTAISPLPDPQTGSYTSEMSRRLRLELVTEIRANAHKLHGASYGEKEKMVLVLSSAPGGSFAKNENALEWAREQKPLLYKDYIDEVFLAISSALYEPQEGMTTFAMHKEASEAATKKIKNAYDEARKARSRVHVR